MPNFSKTALKWALTVLSEISQRLAISWLDAPFAANNATCFSRVVRLAAHASASAVCGYMVGCLNQLLHERRTDPDVARPHDLFDLAQGVSVRIGMAIRSTTGV